MNEINFFYRNHDTNNDSKYIHKSDLLVQRVCRTRWDDYMNEWVETCTDYSDSGKTNSGTSNDINPAGSILNALLVLIILIPFVIFFRSFTKKKGNIKEIKTNMKENFLNKTSRVKKLDNPNNFDLISFIEELKEEKYPDASIGESLVKGSYVILKDLNGKTIAEIKIPE